MNAGMKFRHIMFLPVFGGIDEGLALNIATIIAFLAIYLWHVRHDHRRSEELLREVRAIRKRMGKRRSQPS